MQTDSCDWAISGDKATASTIDQQHPVPNHMERNQF